MAKPKQLTLANTAAEFNDYWKESGRKVHGGAHSQGKRKTKRPFDPKKPIHLVMRSEKARGHLSLNSKNHERPVDHIVRKFAAKFNIRVYQYSNSGNHLHLLLKAKHKSDFQHFLRTISGLIARLILKSKKGAPKGKFWDMLAFTRISEWGKAFRRVKSYVLKNILETAGVIPYERPYRKLEKLFSSG